MLAILAQTIQKMCIKPATLMNTPTRINSPVIKPATLMNNTTRINFSQNNQIQQNTSTTNKQAQEAEKRINVNNKFLRYYGRGRLKLVFESNVRRGLFLPSFVQLSLLNSLEHHGARSQAPNLIASEDRTNTSVRSLRLYSIQLLVISGLIACSKSYSSSQFPFSQKLIFISPAYSDQQIHSIPPSSPKSSFHNIFLILLFVFFSLSSLSPFPFFVSLVVCSFWFSLFICQLPVNCFIVFSLVSSFSATKSSCFNLNWLVFIDYSNINNSFLYDFFLSFLSLLFELKFLITGNQVIGSPSFSCCPKLEPHPVSHPLSQGVVVAERNGNGEKGTLSVSLKVKGGIYYKMSHSIILISGQ
ncbi:hypothetical protein VP01_3779g1 [Puccinia sorghi]|uniref:Uncharacterized protein n=1 Tax=Puccinia sorghi TaxID=27349 RepID=A0A0L6UTS3_9BASI|nr:hypothetical protein VP01_3779g1 [Puccinia sorghi]